MKQAILVTLIHEGLMSQIGIIARVDYESKEGNLEARFRAAASAFRKTERGRQYFEHIRGDFNWGDALSQIPQEILDDWGIKKIEILLSGSLSVGGGVLVLNHDHRLIQT